MTVKSTCCICGSLYESSEAEREMVQAGKLEALCPMCDGSHDSYPPEVEDRDEERRHGLA